MTVIKKTNPVNPNKPWLADVSYTDWQGKKARKRKYFATRREANDWEHDFKNSLTIGTGITFSNLVAAYLEYIIPRIKETTLESKKTIIATKILPYFGNKVLKDISGNDIAKWQTLMIKSNASKTYIKTINTHLSAIFNYAKKFYGLQVNPLHITGSIGRRLSDRMDFYTIDEFHKFYSAVKDRPESKIIFPLLFFSGMRVGELLALTKKDFNYEKHTVSINKTYTRLHKRDVITDPKTPTSIRTIKLPNFIFELLDEYISQLYDYSPSDRLFVVSRAYLLGEMLRGAQKANLKRIRIHDLRHSHASVLINKNYSPALISKRLGHTNITTTLQIYAHLYPEREDDAVSDLQNEWDKENSL